MPGSGSSLAEQVLEEPARGAEATRRTRRRGSRAVTIPTSAAFDETVSRPRTSSSPSRRSRSASTASSGRRSVGRRCGPAGRAARRSAGRAGDRRRPRESRGRRTRGRSVRRSGSGRDPVRPGPIARRRSIGRVVVGVLLGEGRGLDDHAIVVAVPGEGHLADPERFDERLAERSVVGSSPGRPRPGCSRPRGRPGCRAARRAAGRGPRPGSSRARPRPRRRPCAPGGRTCGCRARRSCRRRTGPGHRRCRRDGTWPDSTTSGRDGPGGCCSNPSAAPVPSSSSPAGRSDRRRRR